MKEKKPLIKNPEQYNREITVNLLRIQEYTAYCVMAVEYENHIKATEDPDFQLGLPDFESFLRLQDEYEQADSAVNDLLDQFGLESQN